VSDPCETKTLAALVDVMAALLELELRQKLLPATMGDNEGWLHCLEKLGKRHLKRRASLVSGVGGRDLGRDHAVGTDVCRAEHLGGGTGRD
jgi:hypothetical protein